MIRINQVGGYLVSGFMAVLALGWLFRAGRTRTALLALVLVVSGLVIVEGLRALVARPRPPIAEQWLGAAANSPSFPSGTLFLATMAWGLLALALGSFLTLRPLRWLLDALVAAFILLLGCSPLFLGLHYLSDVLASWSLALVFLVCCRHSAALGLAAGQGPSP